MNKLDSRVTKKDDLVDSMSSVAFISRKRVNSSTRSEDNYPINIVK